MQYRDKLHSPSLTLHGPHVQALSSKDVQDEQRHGSPDDEGTFNLDNGAEPISPILQVFDVVHLRVGTQDNDNYL